ncbi:MAG: hypothetical protein KDB03_14675 [Planctomycetales bacterium]|nr:hypothetical protein [Planctomycetales bacterium]
MLTRTLTILVALMVLSNGYLFSQEPTRFSREKQTRVITLEMSGELAKEYIKITGPIDGDEITGNFNITRTAFIADHLENDQVRIEHSAHVASEGSQYRLVTLTATVDEKNLRSLVRTVLVGDFAFSDSPDANESGKSPIMSTRHISATQLSLTELKGVKLRSWTLESEIGD